MHDNLLSLAKTIVGGSKTSPNRDAELKRCVSTAYYALFHLLIRDAASLIGDGAMSSLYVRSINHAAVLAVAKTFITWSNANKFRDAAEPYKSMIGSIGVSNKMVSVCEAFVKLQQARLDSDYDAQAQMSEEQAESLVRLSSDAFDAWNEIRTTSEARAFMMSVCMHGRERKQRVDGG